MDDQDRIRRQSEAPIQSSPNLRYLIQDSSSQSGSFAGGAPDRYRQMPLNTSPSVSRDMAPPGGYSAYYPEPAAGFPNANMPGADIACGSTDYSQDARSHAQAFSGYNPGMMMYNVPQPHPQSTVYDHQQFQPRQHEPMQLMAPDVPPGYFAAETGPAHGSSLQHTIQSAPGPASLYPQGHGMGYVSPMPSINPVSQAPEPLREAQPQQPVTAVHATISEGHQGPDPALEEKWANYQRQLREVFEDVANGSLERASETLLSISNWLLTQVSDLGLSQDDASLHSDRIKMWNDFNHAWLALGYRQIEIKMTDEPISRSQRPMSEDTIRQMGDELIRLCDGVERHGLVDYQYGVWEDQIESILEDCLDLYQISEGAGTSSGPS